VTLPAPTSCGEIQPSEPRTCGLDMLAPPGAFDDLYSAVYRILDDAKADHALVKLYKGSHASENPHQRVLDFGSFFYRAPTGRSAAGWRRWPVL